ncbi:Chromosome transmission fidelity protein 18 [Grifola frondosa]|uniref:Chromosome transmission fidelity protein 18 n=1 Tax=Grifola frondosa TaxID=5627 RepID=A0A1C7LPA7_GRIFR|nr:Chromosome transmission fidelity protein 18 [Grifola frondosa]
MLKARNRNVTEAIVRNATQGMKEAESSQTIVLNDLFSPLARKRARDLGMGEEDEIRYVARLSREVDGSGAMDKIALGCFEHYANLHRHDANFTRYLKANEWLSTFDVMSGQMRSEREYSLLQYLPYHLVAFYPLFQERGAQKVERPKADWESHTITKMNEEIYKSLARCLRTAGNRHAGDFLHLVNEKILQLELAPMLNRIISPPLRPVNSQVIKPGEKLILSRLVDIMASMELRFMQEKTEDGQLVYRLDPPIDVFITYDGKRASDISVSRYAVRHLVAAEIDARLIAHQADGLEKGKGKKADFFGKKSMKTGDSMENLQCGNKHQKTEPTEKVATDFFGRPIVAIAGDNEKKTGGKMEEKYRVTYRFKEGNSAASVSMSASSRLDMRHLWYQIPVPYLSQSFMMR